MNRRMLLKGSAIAMLGAMNKMAMATEVEGETAKTKPDSAPLENELEKYPRCVICNMDRRQYHYARHLLHYGDGHVEGTCSLNCTAECMLRQRRRGFIAIYAPDYGVAGEPKPLIEASSATYLIGSDLRGVMSPISKYAFADKAKAEAVIAVAGGRIGTFAEAITVAFEDYARYISRRYGNDREKLQRQSNKVNAAT
ncbi:nitrous oxide reductase accessory protein NosL [Azonexus hydrophilus]|uniref:nitrous oxide reductase accessory protein NosL n=1 Tax=Azonexus hydrophilus TaxID=418702 RepID=UPI001F064400|nr:nitrous oxide reductase accessory protein NosL [Azonexus hydrophilus]